MERVKEILSQAGLPPAERRFQVLELSAQDFQPESLLWRQAFEGSARRFLAAPGFEPDLVVGATQTQFVLCLRQGLSAAEQTQMLSHAAGHIALGHIRLNDAFVHADALDVITADQPVRRWDAQVQELLQRIDLTESFEGFEVQGLSEAYARLIAGRVDEPELSALALLRAFADELVEIPEALSDHAQLFPHQKRGLAELVARLRRFNAAVLADSVGLGKTRTACALVKALKDTGRLSRAGVVAPRKLERNWRKEFAVVGLEEGQDIVLINKDQLKRWSTADAARAFKGCDVVIVEEAHQDLRNPSNRFYRNLRDGVGLAQGLLVTATPWNNRRGDIFAILSPFVRAAPGAAGGAFECFKKGFRTGRREFEESDDVFRKVYGLTVLQRTRRQLRDLGDSGVYYAPRAPHLETVPYTEQQSDSFRKLLGVVEALSLPYFNPVRFLTSERDSEWRLSRTHRFMLLKRAESSMAAFHITLDGMRERAEKLRAELNEVRTSEDDMARWLGKTYRIAEEVMEEVLDASLESALMEERVTRPRQRRILRLVEEARAKGQLRALRKRLLADADADIRLLEGVKRDFAALFSADPKLTRIIELVHEQVARGNKVLLVSQFADTAFTVYHSLLADGNVVKRGVGLIMSTAKGGEAPVQLRGRGTTREEVLRCFAPRAWEQNTIEGHGETRSKLQPDDEIAVLVGTDTISVGQNLQDCRTLLHLDLTWNPMMLEQRIGRLDRPRHESDDCPIDIRYFLNLDLIESELELKKRIDARLEATYRDTAFDDEILPGYFDLIERMRQLRAERGDASDLAREIDALIEELAVARPAGLPTNDSEGRRVALERLRAACGASLLGDPLPPLVVTTGQAREEVDCVAQIDFQALDNNDRPIGPPDRRLVYLDATGNGVRLDDLPAAVEGVLRSGRDGVVSEGAAQFLQKLDREILRLADAVKHERNKLREERKRIRDLTSPPWLGPLVRNLRAFVERLPEAQYETFLDRWSLSDEVLATWFDALAAGIDLDDAALVDSVRKLESNPAAFLTDFSRIRDAVPSQDEDEPAAPMQLQLNLEPVVHRVEARVTNLRLNTPPQAHA